MTSLFARSSWLTLGIGLSSAIGCYSYSARPATQIPNGSRVAVTLTTQAASETVSRFGEIIDRLEGTILRVAPDSVRLQVARARLLGGGWSYWANEVVTLPTSAIAWLGQRNMSAKRTVVAAGALAAIVIHLVRTGLFGSGGYDASPDPGPGPPPPH